MIKRLYVHNFRCLENFELLASGHSSLLLIGSNGSGKSTVGRALEVLQRIARGTNRAAELLKPKDLSRGRTDIPMRFELEAELKGRSYHYTVAFELPEGFRELRIFEEALSLNGQQLFSRKGAQVNLASAGKRKEAQFLVDWHLVALPIVQELPTDDQLSIFRQWLSRMLILRPVPSSILGDGKAAMLEPNPEVTNLGDWLGGVLGSAPSAYVSIDSHLKQLMPDFQDLRRPEIGKDYRSMVISFSSGSAQLNIDFEDLSDGEKCFVICAVALAANTIYGPLLCFWDEPDNYLALSEVGHFVIALRKAFQSQGQLIATSHNPEAVSRFSDESIFVLSRRNHLEPTLVRPATDFDTHGDLVGAITRGDLQ